MKKKTIKHCVLFLVAILVLNAIINWAICFDCDGGFEYASVKPFQNIIKDGWTSLRIGEGRGPEIVVPGIFCIYFPEEKPYDLVLELNDRESFLREIVIETVSVEYSDNKKEVLNLDWNAKFSISNWASSQEGELITGSSMRLRAIVPNIIKKNKSCKVRLKGFFKDSENKKIFFDEKHKFNHEPYIWRIYSLSGSF